MKIGILTRPELTTFQQRVLDPVLKDPEFDIRLVIIDDRPTPSLKKRIRKHIRKGRGGYVLIMAIQRYFSGPKNVASTLNFFAGQKAEILRTRRLYKDSIPAAIRKHQLDALILLGGFGIIREPLLSLCPEGMLGYHHGDMRRYRGMPPAFWELYHNEREMGITIQRLAAGLDCGLPLVEKTVPIKPNDSLKSLARRAFGESEGMLYEALNRIKRKEYTQPIESFGDIYTLPKFNQWLKMQFKVFSRKLRNNQFRKPSQTND